MEDQQLTTQLRGTIDRRRLTERYEKALKLVFKKCNGDTDNFIHYVAACWADLVVRNLELMQKIERSGVRP